MTKLHTDPRLDQIISSLHRVASRALIIRDGKLLITKEVSEHPELELRGIPGGGVDRGEDFREALVRELNEELGIVVDEKQISQHPVKIDFCDMIVPDTNYAIPTVQAYYIVSLADHQSPTAVDNDFVWMDADEIKSAKFVLHAKSAVGLLLDQLK